MNCSIVDIRLRPALIPAAAAWFHAKWGVPEDAYAESMSDALTCASGVPAWYVALNDRDEIIAGVGVIENDFHQRKDLTPNVCAVFTEEPHRKQGIARALMDTACRALAAHGVKTCYLITDLTDFYEHCGWTFYGMIPEDDGGLTRCYQHTIE